MEKCSNNHKDNCRIFVICRKGGWNKEEIIDQDVKRIIYLAAEAFYPEKHDYNFSNLADMFRDGEKIKIMGEKICNQFLPPFTKYLAPSAEELSI